MTQSFKPAICLISILTLIGGCATQTSTHPSVTDLPSTQSIPIPSSVSEGKQTAINSLLQQASTLRNQGLDDQAVAILERALRIDPNQALTYYQMALTYFDKGQIQQAKELAQRGYSLAKDKNTQTLIQALLDKL